MKKKKQEEKALEKRIEHGLFDKSEEWIDAKKMLYQQFP